MHHRLEVIDRADGLIGSFVFGFKKDFIDVALNGRRSVNGAEGDAQATGSDERFIQARLLDHIFGDLAGVIGNRSHRLAMRPFKIVINRIVHRSVNTGMDEPADEFVCAKRFNP